MKNPSWGLGMAALGVVGAMAAAVVLLTFERPPVSSAQVGFRGTGMAQIANPRLEPARIAANTAPAPLAPIPAVGPTAGQSYQNVQVLGDLPVGQFTRVMLAMTAWVAPTTGPNAGCAYCHAGNNMADESLYTKAVARRMLQMTAAINKDWQAHVGQTGVTCYTCHRGNQVPANVWSANSGGLYAQGMANSPAGQNRASPVVGQTSLPFDPFSTFLAGPNPLNIRNASTTALPAGEASRRTIKQTEWTYGLMMHFSQATGQNCTFCHNTRNFADWEQAPPQRTTAWHGIRMVRAINNDYITPLTPTFPPHRLGPEGDALKVNCATCHNGVNKPLYGAAMLRDYQELNAVRP